MKTKEELNVLRTEVEELNEKLAELTDEELEAVTAGMGMSIKHDHVSLNALDHQNRHVSALEQSMKRITTGIELARSNATGKITGITGDFTGNYAESEAPSGFQGFNNSNVWGEGQSGEIILPTDINRKGE